MCVALSTVKIAHAQPAIPDSSIAGLYTLLADVESHPRIASYKANIEAARHRIAQQAALPNPMLMLAAQNVPTNSFSFSQDMMTGKMIGASQEFFWPGKLKTQGEITAVDTLTSEDDLDDERNQLERDAKLAYFDLYHIERVIAVYDFHHKATDALLRLAESKLPEGKSTQADVLDLELERGDIADQIVMYQTKLRESQTDLEQATDESVAISITPALGLVSFPYTIAKLDSMAHLHNPLLHKLKAEAEQESLRYKRADLDKYPDFQVSLEYMQRNTLPANAPMNPFGVPMPQSDVVSAGVSIELPLNYNNQRTEALVETEAMQTMRRFEEAAEELKIHTELESDLAQLHGFEQEYAILRDQIFPASHAALQTSTANLTYDRVTIDNAIRDDLNLIHREHDRYRLEAEYNKTIAEMEYLTGTMLVIYTSQNNWK